MTGRGPSAHQPGAVYPSPVGSWSAYYDRHVGRPPRDDLGRAVAAVSTPDDRPRQAADLGFGQGTETIALLEQGWRVFAVDSEADAEQRLRSRLAPSDAERLVVAIASFAEVKLPPCDLVWSGLALPFCPPDRFSEVWRRVRDALRPGGVVAVDLFGPNHGWASRTATISRDQLDLMLAGLEVLAVDEQDAPRPTVSDGVIQWHAYSILARRPQ